MMDEINIDTTTVAGRLVHGTPIGLRWARTRMDGGFYSDELQAAYRWEQGAEGGVEWRAIDIVDVTGTR